MMRSTNQEPWPFAGGSLVGEFRGGGGRPMAPERGPLSPGSLLLLPLVGTGVKKGDKVAALAATAALAALLLQVLVTVILLWFRRHSSGKRAEGQEARPPQATSNSSKWKPTASRKLCSRLLMLFFLLPDNPSVFS